MKNPSPRSRLLVMVMCIEGGLGLFALALGWLIDLPAHEGARFTVRAGVDALLATLVLLVFFQLVLRFPIQPFLRIRVFLEDTVRPMFLHCSIKDMFFVAMLAGVGEELLFRGLLQRLFSGWWGWEMGVLGSNILFGLAHLITPMYSVITFCIGLFLSWTFIATDNLAVPVLIHWFYDFFALVIFLRFTPPFTTPNGFLDSTDSRDETHDGSKEDSSSLRTPD